MYDVWLFDIVLVIVLIAYAVYGFRRGFIRSIAAFAGLAVGAVVGFFVVPLIGNWVADSSWRIAIVLAAAAVFVIGGYAAGTAVGQRLGRRAWETALHVPDRILGAVVNVIATALVVALISTTLASFGIPLLSRAIGQSSVLRIISALTPDPLESFLAQVRSTLVQDGLPAITEALGGIVNPPDIPDVNTGTDALSQASQSVVRITGTAAACSQNQAGSGFIVAKDRVITNAHVVSGVTQPVIETRDGQVLTGTIVYFDPKDDLAVIAVPGLKTKPLTLTDTVGVDSEGAIDGYPFGGPFVTSPAKVVSVDTASVNDIYGKTRSDREVYSLATTVNEGDSGGPFLTEKGEVAGVVFAKSANTANLGYAMTMKELDPVAAQAAGLSSGVSSGSCVRG